MVRLCSVKQLNTILQGAYTFIHMESHNYSTMYAQWVKVQSAVEQCSSTSGPWLNLCWFINSSQHYIILAATSENVCIILVSLKILVVQHYPGEKCQSTLSDLRTAEQVIIKCDTVNMFQFCLIPDNKNGLFP